MKKGQINDAERKALNVLETWNDVTGALDGGWYRECQAVVEDAVHIGIQMAMYGKVYYDEDGAVKRYNNVLNAQVKDDLNNRNSKRFVAMTKYGYTLREEANVVELKEILSNVMAVEENQILGNHKEVRRLLLKIVFYINRQMLNSEQNVKECDASKADSSNEAR